MEQAAPFVGSWSVEVAFGEETPPDDVNPLATIGQVTCTADGALIGSGSLAYAAPAGGPGDQIFVGAVHGAWQSTGKGTADFNFEALLRNEGGHVIGLIQLGGSVEYDAESDTLTGSYGAFVRSLSRAWTRNPAIPAGSLRARRIRVTRPG